MREDLLHDVDLRVVLGIGVRVDLEAEESEELREESLVHVLAHLVEDEPVPDAAVGDVVLDVPHVLVLAQIPSHQLQAEHPHHPPLCIIIFIKKYLTLLDISWMLLVTILLMPARMRTQCQTQRMANTWRTIQVMMQVMIVRLTLSLIMLSERMQSAPLVS